MLSIDKIKEYWVQKNTSRPNNLNDSLHNLAVYNDAINLYQAIEAVVQDSVVSDFNTNLGAVYSASNVEITSSTGTGVTIDSASSSLAGLMSSTDKNNLTKLGTLSGVSLGSTNLGSFTGSIIQDNRTIKQALQDLETSLDSGTGLSLGNLTSTTNDLTITNGSNSVFNASGVTITFNPSNVSLSEFAGTLPLTKLSTSGVSTNSVLTYNGSN